MIKIAIAAALAALIVCDVTVLPASTGETIERPRGLKGDRLPIRPTGAGCNDVVWHHHDVCVGGDQQPGKQTPGARHVRIAATDHTSAGNPVPSFAI
ncbi:MAG TPA: hypothetical protein VIU42_00545 [Xanthobacteraceae bacterium]|jgi:hypothetical protein